MEFVNNIGHGVTMSNVTTVTGVLDACKVDNTHVLVVWRYALSGSARYPAATVFTVTQDGVEAGTTVQLTTTAMYVNEPAVGSNIRRIAILNLGNGAFLVAWVGGASSSSTPGLRTMKIIATEDTVMIGSALSTLFSGSSSTRYTTYILGSHLVNEEAGVVLLYYNLYGTDATAVSAKAGCTAVRTLGSSVSIGANYFVPNAANTNHPVAENTVALVGSNNYCLLQVDGTNVTVGEPVSLGIFSYPLYCSIKIAGYIVTFSTVSSRQIYYSAVKYNDGVLELVKHDEYLATLSTDVKRLNAISVDDASLLVIASSAARYYLAKFTLSSINILDNGTLQVGDFDAPFYEAPTDGMYLWTFSPILMTVDSVFLIGSGDSSDSSSPTSDRLYGIGSATKRSVARSISTIDGLTKTACTTEAPGKVWVLGS